MALAILSSSLTVKEREEVEGEVLDMACKVAVTVMKDKEDMEGKHERVKEVKRETRLKIVKDICVRAYRSPGTWYLVKRPNGAAPLQSYYHVDQTFPA